jgi:endonuclease YncB( thermonuclease family)
MASLPIPTTTPQRSAPWRRAWRRCASAFRSTARALALALPLLLGTGAAGEAAAIEGLAQVQDDGSLSINGQTIHLFGVYIPLLDRRCRTSIQPPRCGASSTLALDLEVTGFVHCTPVGRLADGSLTAVCTQRTDRIFEPPEDLGAWMIEQGWGLAAANAPPEYRALEQLARSREVGLWGSQIKNFR